MSEQNTASLILEHKSVGVEKTKREAAEIKAAHVGASKEIYNAHVFLYQERMRLQKEWVAAAKQREREVADAVRIQSAAAAAAYKTQAQAEKQAAREALAEVKQAAREKAAAEKQASREAIQAAREAANAQKQAARESAQSTKSSSAATRVGLGFMAGQNLSIGGLASVNPAVAATVATGYMVSHVTSDAVKEAAKWERFRLAITDVEGSAAKAGRTLDDLYNLAKRPGIGLEEAEKGYLKLKSVGIEGEKAKNVLLQFSNAAALSGGGATEMGRAVEQLVQMQSKGRVLQEDLKHMKDAIPAINKAMMQAFGTTNAEAIRGMGINAEQFLNGILAAMAKMPEATQTLTSELENAETAMSKLKASFVNTDFVKDVVGSWTGLLESLTKAIETKSVRWGELVKDVFNPYLGLSGMLGKAAAGAYNDSPQEARFRERQTKVDRLLELRKGSVTIARAKEAKAIQDWLETDRVSRKAIEDAAANDKDTQDRMALLNVAPKAGPTKKEKAKSVTNPLDVIGDKRYLTVDQLQGRNLLEAQAAIDKALMADQDKANAEAQKMREANNEATLKEYEAEGQKLLAVQAKLDELLKADVEKQNAEAQKANEDRIKALQELREAEAGEYQLRLIQIESWGEQMKTRVGNDEEAITRITKEQAHRRTLIYLEAASNITGSVSGLFGSIAAMSKQYNEDNTREYAKWVAISQSLAIAEAGINIAVAMSKALKSGFTTLDGLAQMAAVASAGGQIINSIAAMNAAKVGKGAFDKGGSLGYGEFGIAGENGPEIITGPARITSTRDTARALAAKSSVSVNVHNYAGASVDVQQQDDGSIDVIVDKLASQIEERIASNVATGTGVLNKAVTGAYGLRRNGR